MCSIYDRDFKKFQSIIGFTMLICCWQWTWHKNMNILDTVSYMPLFFPKELYIIESIHQYDYRRIYCKWCQSLWNNFHVKIIYAYLEFFLTMHRVFLRDATVLLPESVWNINLQSTTVLIEIAFVPFTNIFNLRIKNDYTAK